uniref:Uncharacterized protein n=1 Tax=Nelumbo nucifera TaxID=4432 RepID=A0A822Y668_NELNU|nr:TPA_asm: hypothetical protein HUJ06_030952 [Nelumbo nucifera]
MPQPVHKLLKLPVPIHGVFVNPYGSSSSISLFRTEPFFFALLFCSVYLFMLDFICLFIQSAVTDETEGLLLKSPSNLTVQWDGKK